MLFNLPASALLFTLLSLQTLALPSPSAEITVTHSDAKTGTASSHVIDPSVLHPDLLKAMNGSDININVVTKRRVPPAHAPRAGVNNSTVNLTIVSKRDLEADASAAPAPAPADDPSHHNVYIDASAGNGTAGAGIVGSTININLNSRSPKPEAAPATTVGDHSIVIDTSATANGTAPGAGGITDSTVHVNILPAHRSRRSDKATGDHSIVIDSSSSTGSTTTGEHSAVVDATSSDAATPAGINGSTINLTVISPKKDASKRSPSGRGSDLWKEQIRRKAFQQDSTNQRFAKLRIKRGVNGIRETSHASKA